MSRRLSATFELAGLLALCVAPTIVTVAYVAFRNWRAGERMGHDMPRMP